MTATEVAMTATTVATTHASAGLVRLLPVLVAPAGLDPELGVGGLHLDLLEARLAGRLLAAVAEQVVAAVLLRHLVERSREVGDVEEVPAAGVDRQLVERVAQGVLHGGRRQVDRVGRYVVGVQGLDRRLEVALVRNEAAEGVLAAGEPEGEEEQVLAAPDAAPGLGDHLQSLVEGGRPVAQGRAG